MTCEQHWIAAMLLLGSLVAECAAAPKAVPVAHWAMTEPPGATLLADSSGHNRSATIESGIQTGAGRSANAVRFSGEREAHATFEAPPLSALTLAAWVKVTGMGKGDKPYPRIIEWPRAFLHASSGHFGEVNLTFWAGKGHWSSSGRAGAFDQWTHVALTYDCSDAANVPIFYINGRKVPYAAGKPPAKPTVLRGGKGFLGNNGACNRPFEGLMNDVRMYDVVLTPSEIESLAQRTPDGDAPKDFVRVFDDELPVVDISGEKQRHVVIAAGTKEIYQGHATTLLLPDGLTMFAVWCLEHGGRCGPMARSDDAGLTWTRLDDALPSGFRKHRNCPSLYRIVDSQGKGRFWVISGGGRMGRLMSEDDGKTWVEVPALAFRCGMPFTGMIRLNDGRTAAFGQQRVSGRDQGVVMSVTDDGGLTWSPPRVIAKRTAKNLCEPFVLRSPDGQELCCLMRENRHTATSMMCFSRDEGKTWTAPVDTAWGLTGDRHLGVQAPDGRWLIAFRDRALRSSTYGQFVAWVGTYEDIRQARPGQFRIKLLHNYAGVDCGYPGMELLPDGTIVATTYTKYWGDERRHSVVSTRFKLDELRVKPARRPAGPRNR